MPLAPLQARYRQQPWMLPGALSPDEENPDSAFNPQMGNMGSNPDLRPEPVEQFPPAPPKEPMPAPPVMEGKASMPPPGSEELGPESGPDEATHDKPDKPHAEPTPVDDSEAAVAAEATPSKPQNPRDAALAKTKQFSTPTEMHSNVAQRLGLALLSVTKLAPYANQIVHPKWSEQERARKANLAGAEQELKDTQGAELGAAQTRHAAAQATLAEQQAATLDREGKRAPKSNYITVPGGGLYDAEHGEWVKQPVDKSQLTAIPKEQAVEWGISPLSDGTFAIPNSAVGQYISSQKDKSVKTIEERLVQVMGDESAPPEQKKQQMDDLVKAHNLLHPQTPIHGIETDAAGNSTLVVADPANPQSVQKIPLGAIGKKEKPTEPPHAMMVGPDGVAYEVKPGTHVTPGSQTTQGVNTMSTPTGQTRSMAEMAKTVTEQVPSLLTQVDALNSKIGPGAGRWNNFWVNKGGLNDPDYAGLDQDLDLFASALVRTHFGGRGGQGYREALKKDFSMAQSPEDLKSRIQHADKWIQGYAKAGESKPGGQPGGVPQVGGTFNGGKVLKVTPIP